MPPTDVCVRAAAIADLDQILLFIHQKAAFDGFSEPITITPAALQQTLFSASPCAKVAFVEVDQTAVGFVLFSQSYSSFLAQPTIWIDDLFVQSNWRRQGLGTALLKYVAQIAQNRGCGRIEWTVATRNDAGIGFYQQRGADIREDVRLCRLSAQTIEHLVNAV